MVSGGYKGAADELDIRVTKVAFETILSIVDFPTRYDSDTTMAKWKETLRDVLYKQQPRQYLCIA